MRKLSILSFIAAVLIPWGGAARALDWRGALGIGVAAGAAAAIIRHSNSHGAQNTAPAQPSYEPAAQPLVVAPAPVSADQPPSVGGAAEPLKVVRPDGTVVYYASWDDYNAGRPMGADAAAVTAAPPTQAMAEELNAPQAKPEQDVALQPEASALVDFEGTPLPGHPEYHTRIIQSGMTAAQYDAYLRESFNGASRAEVQIWADYELKFMEKYTAAGALYGTSGLTEAEARSRANYTPFLGISITFNRDWEIGLRVGREVLASMTEADRKLLYSAWPKVSDPSSLQAKPTPDPDTWRKTSSAPERD